MVKVPPWYSSAVVADESLASILPHSDLNSLRVRSEVQHLAEAALSFLGLGISEPSASWGLMLKQSQGNMIVFFMNFWWMLTPGLAIFVTVIAYNVLGDVLRDIVDPKMQTR